MDVSEKVNMVLRGLQQYFAEHPDVEFVGAVDANKYLDKKGILGDSKSRRGLPLRKLLREGEIPNAKKVGHLWRIYRR